MVELSLQGLTAQAADETRQKYLEKLAEREAQNQPTVETYACLLAKDYAKEENTDKQRVPKTGVSIGVLTVQDVPASPPPAVAEANKVELDEHEETPFVDWDDEDLVSRLYGAYNPNGISRPQSGPETGWARPDSDHVRPEVGPARPTPTCDKQQRTSGSLPPHISDPTFPINERIQGSSDYQSLVTSPYTYTLYPYTISDSDTTMGERLAGALDEWGRVGVSRAVGLIVQVSLFIMLIIGSWVEFTFKTLFMIMTTISLVMTLQFLMGEVRNYKNRRKILRLRQPLSCWGHLWAFLLGFDEKQVRAARRSGHLNSRLPDEYYIRRKSLTIGRQRSTEIVRQRVNSLNLDRHKNTIRVSFKPQDIAGERLYLPARVCGVDSKLLLDSGSQATVISERYLRILEAKLGRPLIRMQNTHTLVGLGNDTPVENMGVVLVNISFVSDLTNKNLVLESIPAYVVSNTNFSFILGANVFTRLQTNINFGQKAEAWVTFSKVPQFEGMKALLLDHEFVPLEIDASCVLPPKQWIECDFSVPNGKNVPSDMDGKDLLLEVHPEFESTFKVNHSHVHALKKGKTKVLLQNTTGEPIQMAGKTELFMASVLTRHSPIDVSPMVAAANVARQCNPMLLDRCYCALEERSTLAFITDCLGYTHMGTDLRTPFEKEKYTNSGVYKLDGRFFFVPDKFKHFALFSQGFANNFVSKHRFKNNHLTVVVATPMMLDKTFMDLALLLRRSLHCDIRYLDANHLCAKHRHQSVSALISYPEFRNVTRLNVIVPSTFRFNFGEGENQNSVLQQLRNRPVIKFDILNGYNCHAYLNKTQECTLFLHLPEIKGSSKDFTRNMVMFLFSEIKRVWPYVELRVLSNVAKNGKEGINALLQDTPQEKKSNFLTGIEEALHLSKWLLSYDFPVPTKVKRMVEKAVNQVLPARLSTKHCSCTYCLSAQHPKEGAKSYGLQTLFQGNWPDWSEDELIKNLDHLQDMDTHSQAVLHVASLSTVAKPKPFEFDPPKSELLENEESRSVNLMAVEETFLHTDNIFTPANESLYSALPIPRTSHRPVTLAELDAHIDFTKIPDSRLIAPLRLLLFLYRDTMRIFEDDFGVVRSYIATLQLKKAYIGVPWHAKGFNISAHLLEVVREITEKYCDLGVWTKNSKVLISSPIFIVLRSSAYKHQVYAKENANENPSDRAKRSSQVGDEQNSGCKSEIIRSPQQLEAPTADQLRIVIDCREVNKRLVDHYSNYNIRNLSQQDIGSFCEGSQFLTGVDVSLSYNSQIVREQDRPILGLKLGKLDCFRAVSLLMGIKNSPVTFVNGVAKALDPRTLSVILMYMDDFLICSRKALSVPPLEQPCSDAASVDFKRPPCVNCKSKLCTGCEQVQIVDKNQFAPHTFEMLGEKIHAIPPDRKDIFQNLFEKHDPLQLLPRDQLVRDYYTYPVQKGVKWEESLEEQVKEYPKKHMEAIDFDQVKNHFENLACLFQCIRRHGSKMTLRKTTFFSSEGMKFFGLKYSGTHCSILEEKKVYFNKFRNIENVRQLQSFLGGCLHLSIFIDGLAHLTRSLYNIVSLPPKSPLSPLNKQIVNYIIDRIVDSPKLCLAPSNVGLVIIADASGVAAGIQCGFEDAQGIFHLCSFASYGFSECLARNLSAIDKELFAYSYFLLQNSSILQREVPTTIICDNRSLQKLANCDQLPPHGRLYKVLQLLRSLPIRMRFRWRPSSDPQVKVSDFLSRLHMYRYFSPGSVAKKEVDRALKEKNYYECLEDIRIPDEVATKDWDMVDLPILQALYDDGFFTATKEFKQQTRSEFLQNFNVSISNEQDPKALHGCCSPFPKCQLGLPATIDEKTFDEQSLVFCQSEMLRAATNLMRARDGDTDKTGRTDPTWKTIFDQDQAMGTRNTLPFLCSALHLAAANLGGPPMQKAMIDSWQKRYVSLENIQEDQLQDPDYRDILSGFIHSPPTSWKKKWTKHFMLLPSLLLARKPKSDDEIARIVLPSRSALLIMCAAHVFTHGSVETLVKMVKPFFHVNRIRNLAELIIQNCMPCLLNKYTGPRPLYVPGRLEISHTPFGLITLDHVTLPKCAAGNEVYEHCLGIFCTFSKMSVYLPVKSLNAHHTIKALETFFINVAVPRRILTDMGSTFISAKFLEFLDRNGVVCDAQMPYAPFSHRTENENRIFSFITTMFMTALKTTNWYQLLPRINLALRSLPREYHLANAKGEINVVKLSPHFFIHGYHPPLSFNQQVQELLKFAPSQQEVLKFRTDIFEERKKADEIEKAAFNKADAEAFEHKRALKPFDYVLMKQLPHKKYTSYYTKNIYQVVSVHKRKVCVRAVFATKPTVFKVHISHLKPLTLKDGVFDDLTPSLKLHLGGNINLPTAYSVLDSGGHKLRNLPLALQSVFQPDNKVRPTRARGRPTRARTHASDVLPNPMVGAGPRWRPTHGLKAIHDQQLISPHSRPVSTTALASDDGRSPVPGDLLRTELDTLSNSTLSFPKLPKHARMAPLLDEVDDHVSLGTIPEDPDEFLTPMQDSPPAQPSNWRDRIFGRVQQWLRPQTPDAPLPSLDQFGPTPPGRPRVDQRQLPVGRQLPPEPSPIQGLPSPQHPAPLPAGSPVTPIRSPGPKYIPPRRDPLEHQSPHSPDQPFRGWTPSEQAQAAQRRGVPMDWSSQIQVWDEGATSYVASPGSPGTPLFHSSPRVAQSTQTSSASETTYSPTMIQQLARSPRVRLNRLPSAYEQQLRQTPVPPQANANVTPSPSPIGMQLRSRRVPPPPPATAPKQNQRQTKNVVEGQQPARRGRPPKKLTPKPSLPHDHQEQQPSPLLGTSNISPQPETERSPPRRSRRERKPPLRFADYAYH